MPNSSSRGAPGISLEAELLIHCARARPDGETIQAFLREDMDWQQLLNLASRHGVAAALYRSLKTTLPGAVPEVVLTQLRTRVYQSVARNLLLQQELVAVMKLFEDHGIPAVPFKGPILAEFIYGDLSFRSFEDLDILVHVRNFSKAENLLISQGYRQKHQFGWAANLVHEISNVEVDLHHQIAPSYFAFRLDFAGLWERHELLPIAGTRMPNLSPEDLLTFLSVQAAKDYWEKRIQLAKIRDLAMILDRHRDLNWQQLFERSQIQGGQRMTLFGLRLAHDLLDAFLPEEVLRKTRDVPLVDAASAQLREFIRSGQPVTKAIFLGGESLPGRLRYILPFVHRVRYIFRIALTPSRKDRDFLPLPNGCWPFYYLLRPIRLIAYFVSNPIQALKQLRLLFH